jgi:fluoride ion exporter CrcB/FEX
LEENMGSIQEELQVAVKKRTDRAIVGFVIGAVLGAVFGMDLAIGLVAGCVGAFITWSLFSSEVERLKKIQRIKED